MPYFFSTCTRNSCTRRGNALLNSAVRSVCRACIALCLHMADHTTRTKKMQAAQHLPSCALPRSAGSGVECAADDVGPVREVRDCAFARPTHIPAANAPPTIHGSIRDQEDILGELCSRILRVRRLPLAKYQEMDTLSVSCEFQRDNCIRVVFLRFPVGHPSRVPRSQVNHSRLSSPRCVPRGYVPL